MNTIFLGLGAIAAGWYGKRLYDEHQAKTVAADDARKKALGMAATSLQRGRSYTLQLTTMPSEVKVNDQKQMSDIVKTTFEQLGFTVLSTPMPMNTAEASKFLAGQSSCWVLQGTWTRTDDKITSVPSWIGMVMAYEMPTT